MKKYIALLFLVFLFPININALTDTSKSSIVMDVDSGRILYSKNPNDVRLIASTTKIMTAIITLENSDINKEVIVGEEVLKMYGTNIYLEVGEKMSIKNLLYGLLLRSGNDASVVLAKNIGNTEKEFVKIAIAGGKDALNEFCAPCGVCRQVMAEFCDAESFEVVLGNETEQRSYLLKELLPLGFGAEDIGG